MRKIFFGLLFFISNNLVGQIKIHYNAMPIVDERSKINSMIKDMSPDYEQLCKMLDFVLLLLKGNKSYFLLDDRSKIDDVGVDMFLASANYSGLVVQENDSIYKQTNFDHFGKKFIVTDTIQSNWKLTNESKEIMGYKCYKAETIAVVINSKGTFKNPVYAWYCPQFPYQFGPVGFGKLPGLIFELQTKFALFGITKIETNATMEKFPEFDKKSENISEKNLNNLINKLHNERVEIMKKEEDNKK